MRKVLAGGGVRIAVVSGHPTQTSWSVPEVQDSRAAQKSIEDLCYAYHIQGCQAAAKVSGQVGITF